MYQYFCILRNHFSIFGFSSYISEWIIRKRLYRHSWPAKRYLISELVKIRLRLWYGLGLGSRVLLKVGLVDLQVRSDLITSPECYVLSVSPDKSPDFLSSCLPVSSCLFLSSCLCVLLCLPVFLCLPAFLSSCAVCTSQECNLLCPEWGLNSQPSPQKHKQLKANRMSLNTLYLGRGRCRCASSRPAVSVGSTCHVGGIHHTSLLSQCCQPVTMNYKWFQIVMQHRDTEL